MSNEYTNEKNEMTEIVGVRFRDAGKVYYFAPNGITVKSGECVIVETARGVEFGFAASGNSHVPTAKIVPPLRPVLRVATAEDCAHYEENKKLVQRYVYEPENTFYCDIILRNEYVLIHATMSCDNGSREIYEPIFENWMKEISLVEE